MKQSFYTANRQATAKATRGGLTVLTAYSLMQRSGDMASKFDQEANFWYLTGIDESDWWVIIDGSSDKSWLVAPDVDEIHRIFEGGMTFEEAKNVSGIQEVIRHADSEALLRRLSKKHSLVYTLGDHPHRDYFNFVENPAQKKLTAVLERTFNGVQDCRKELSKLRAIKQPEEIAAMKKAIKLTNEAFIIAKEKLSECKYEYEVEAEFDYYFKRNGVGHAYDRVVAAGKNACTMHYVRNDAKLKKGSLLLIDIGAKYNNYSADITRTYAIGEPTKRQVMVHKVIERSHNAIIKLLKPGLSIAAYHEQVDVIMKQALIELGLLQNTDDTSRYRTYFPHAISHGLGIDPHDPLGAPTTFQEGMVLTVEPGIYIPEEGIGVRLEDDILITKNGHDNLSKHLSTGL